MGLLHAGGGEEKEDEEVVGDTKTMLDLREEAGDMGGDSEAGEVAVSMASMGSGTTVEHESREREEEMEPFCDDLGICANSPTKPGLGWANSKWAGGNSSIC